MTKTKRKTPKSKTSSPPLQQQQDPLTTSLAFRVLLGLVVFAFFVSSWLFVQLDAINIYCDNTRNGAAVSSPMEALSLLRRQWKEKVVEGVGSQFHFPLPIHTMGAAANSNNNSSLFTIISSHHEEDSKQQQQLPPPHLYPRLPHLPIFPSIDTDGNDEDTLIHRTLYENQPTIAGIAAILYRFLTDLHESNHNFATNGQTNNAAHDADAIRAAYFGLVVKHLLPLDAAYRGRTTFPVRNDDSIYVSVAAFREHLLADTLMSAYTSADHPEKLFVGVIVNNCFGKDDNGQLCQGTPRVVGKDKNGRDILEAVDGIPDINHITTFCSNTTFSKYCDDGQVRVLYVNETDALGPAVARYYSSKLWGGETYYVQIDAHLKFANGWDTLYIEDLKATKSYPKAVLSTYPPGFVNFRQEPPYTPGTRLCRCQMRDNEEWLPRVEMEGRCKEDEVRPTQMAFIGAGFFFARGDFLVDVPFDPFLAWMFMGEEIALSIRAWTSGWNIYAPRKNLIGHQYRPLSMHTPHYWTSVKNLFHRPLMCTRAESQVRLRIKYMMGYPEVTLESILRGDERDNRHHQQHHDESYNVLLDLEHYGLGKERTREEYLKFAEIDLDKKTCGAMKWCSGGDLE